jgi:hypothetical protein
MTTRLLLAFLALFSSLYSYLLLGPVGLGCYLGMGVLVMLIEPIRHKTADRLAYTSELAAFRRDWRIASRLAAHASGGYYHAAR